MFRNSKKQKDLRNKEIVDEAFMNFFKKERGKNSKSYLEKPETQWEKDQKRMIKTIVDNNIKKFREEERIKREKKISFKLGRLKDWFFYGIY